MVGLQSGVPGGISIKHEINEQWTAQLLLDVLRSNNLVTSYGGRINYTFRDEHTWQAFCYGSLAYYSLDWWYYHESAFGFGAGCGVEWDFEELIDLPVPLFASVDLGLAMISFPEYGAGVGGLFLGFGLHYQF
ncbi:MAG: hypothetical protein KDC10_12335 [Calditrichaeota bacterium]|nr:hypothetical protein [Calditrichota bacterium]